MISVWNILLSIFVASFFIFLFVVIIPFYRRVSILRSLPGPPVSHLFDSHAKNFKPISKAFPMFRENAVKYPKICRYILAPWMILVMVSHPEVLKQVYTELNYDKRISKKSLWRKKDTVFFAEGLEWKDKRKMFNPACHADMLNQYIKPLERNARVIMERWTMHCDQSEFFDSSQDIRIYILDSLVQTVFSLQGSIQGMNGIPFGEYMCAQNLMNEAIYYRQTRPHLYLSFLYNLTSHSKRFYRAQDVIYKVHMQFVKERQQEIKTLGSTEKRDFCTILLTTPKSDGTFMSDEEIENEIYFFIFAGYETASSSIDWAIYCLGKYPEFQKKCREEIQKVLGDNEEITTETIQKLEFTTMFLKESMRIHPPVTNALRVNNKPLEIDGYKIPKGTSILISVFQAHHLEEFWPDPDKFDPNRFSSENRDKIHPYSYLPFSTGPRNCVGESLAMMQMLIFLSLLIQKYNITVHEDQSIEPVIGLACHPRDGIKIKLEKVKYLNSS